MHRIRRFLCVAALSVPVVSAIAQTPTGTIEGRVTEKTGAAVQGASITILKTDTNETHAATTDASGRYTIPFVPPGTYSVIAEAPSFHSSKQENVIVQVAGTRSVDFKLEVGSVSQTINVISSAETLDTSTSSLGETIPSQLILDLPDNGRNPFDFALLVPGVNNTGNASTPHIGGSRNGNNEQQIDGMTNILPENNVGNNSSAYSPIVDSVQEVNVQTSVLPAEYGRFSGGTISLITKSGTNHLHGSFFEFAQDGSMDANVFQFGGGKGSKPDMHRYQTGGTVGGPIVLPFYNGHDKSFFFFDYENSREADGASSTYSVPNPAWLQGDFTGLYGTTVPKLFDPYTVAPLAPGSSTYVRQPLVGDDGSYNKLPSKYLSSAASKVAQAALGYYPAPNIPGAGEFNNYRQTGSLPANYWHYDARLDQDVTKKWHSFLRFSQEYGFNTVLNDYGNAASPSNYGGPNNYSSLSISFNNTVSFSPTLLGEFRYGLSKATSNRNAFSSGFELSTLGFPASFQTEAAQNALLFPHFGFSGGFSDLGTQGYVPLQEDPLAQDVNGSLVKIVGGHSIKVGGEYRLLRLNFYQYGYPSGTFNVDESWTRMNPQISSDGTGFSFASMMLGLPASGDINHDPKVISTSNYGAIFAQDDWKVTRKLTLNLGLRYDFEIPRVEKNNQMSYWNASAKSPLGAVTPAPGVNCPNCGNLLGQMVLVATSASHYGRHQGPTQLNDWGPRIGLAYNPTTKLVIRSGFGLVYQPSALQAAGTSGAPGIEGFATQTNFSPSFNNQQSAPVADLSNPFPSGFLVPQGVDSACRASATCVQSIDIGSSVQQSFFDSYRTPYSIQWNASVQYALPASIKLELGYLANRGVFLINGDPGRPYDQLPTSDLALGSALLAQVPNPFYGIIDVPGSNLSQPTVQASQLLRKWPQYQNVSSFRKPGADSRYNAFTLRADKQFNQGLTFTFSFTDSRAYDNSASAVNYLGAASQTYADQYNPKAEWGLSAQNVSYQIAASFLYELPFGGGKPFLNSSGRGANLLINGWQVSGIENWSTGTPIVLSSVDNGTTSSALNTFPQRPAWNSHTAKVSDPSSRQWFNPTVFSIPAPYTIGNAPRTLDNVNNPNYQNLDASLAKNTKFGERYSLQLRLEMFNAFNHPLLSGPDSNVKDGNFGKITGYSNSARRLQLGAKFYY